MKEVLGAGNVLFLIWVLVTWVVKFVKNSLSCSFNDVMYVNSFLKWGEGLKFADDELSAMVTS